MTTALYKKIALYFPTFIVFLNTIILPKISLAADPCVGGRGTDGVLKYCPLEQGAFNTFTPATGASQLGQFLSQAFQFGLALAAALAVVMIVWGGVQYMLSESLFSKDAGKEKISNAIFGLLLALVSWLILYIINPDILNFKL